MTGSHEQINGFLQMQLGKFGREDVPAVEAASWLDRARLLSDSPSRPGLPLRNLLRAGHVVGSEQRPPQRYGRWFITRM